VVAAGVEGCKAAAIAACGGGAIVHIQVPPTAAAAAVQHAVRHALTLADEASTVAVVCTVEAEPEAGAKRSRVAEACFVYAVIGTPRSVGEDGSSSTDLKDNRTGNHQLETNRDGGSVDTKRHC
jgi:hypothetical protein